MKTVTVDTNVITIDELFEKGRACGFEMNKVTVTKRELEPSSLVNAQRDLGTILETAVWGESRWDECEWSDDESKDFLEEIFRIISSDSFPKERDSLSNGQRRQLRDAMIFQAHFRDNRDIFVSDDKKAFINNGRRAILENTFNTKILTSEEFLEYCQNLEDKKLRK